MSNWIVQGISFAILATGTLLYYWAWRRLRQPFPWLATRSRAIFFGAGVLILFLGLILPLPIWSHFLLSMRSLQKVLLCMIAPILLWAACPAHIILRALPYPGRTRLYRTLYGHNPGGQLIRRMTQPVVVWVLYVSAFTLWHDPTFANLILAHTPAHLLLPWLLLVTAILFWWPVVGTGPRIHQRSPSWLLIVYLIGVEVPNMVTGIAIAFAATPLYPHYERVHATLTDATGYWFTPPFTLPILIDQMIGGAIIWVFGSFFYIASIVAIVNRLFHEEGSRTPQHPVDWDAQEKFIAPGLEHRVVQNRHRNVDLRHK